MEQYVFEDTVIKFIDGIHDSELRFKIMEYTIETNINLSKVFKKVSINEQILTILKKVKENLDKKNTRKK